MINTLKQVLVFTVLLQQAHFTRMIEKKQQLRNQLPKPLKIDQKSSLDRLQKLTFKMTPKTTLKSIENGPQNRPKNAAGALQNQI